MTCSELNFVSSQHFYGLCIAKAAELPSLKDGDEAWLAALAKLNRLAKISAQQQIAHNEEKPQFPFYPSTPLSYPSSHPFEAPLGTNY